MWTVPHRLFTVRGFRCRRTAFSEWTPHFGHAGLRGPAALANWPNQVARSCRPTFSTRSSRASKSAVGSSWAHVQKVLTASVADASICSRRAVSNELLRSGPPCFLRGGPLLRWPQPTRPTCPPGSRGDDFRLHPRGQYLLTRARRRATLAL